LDLDVCVGRGDFDLDEAEFVVGRRNAGHRELVEEQEAGGAQSGGHASTTKDQDWGRSEPGAGFSSAQREEPIVDWSRSVGVERR
jgi:hypothetical protein